jgi:hypothetical protein
MFLNPLFLWALGLIGIPVLIHLIRRRRLKVVRWAAMDFLLQSQRKQRRRLRIEELILLTLRILIIAFAALALARPVLRSLGIPLLAQNTPVYAIIALDNSFSMDHKGSDGKRSFDRAQTAAREILTRVLRPGDSASVVLLSDKPEAYIGSPSFDLKAVQDRLRGVKVSDRATDYLETAKTVLKLLRASQATIKEVYWITDDQAGAWATSRSDAARTTWTELSRQARMLWVSCGSSVGKRDNLAIETPTLGRELVTPQLPARIEANVFNFGAQTRNNVLVKLILDDKEKASRQVNLPAGGSAKVEFAPRLVDPGTHTGRIELENAGLLDGLERDNRAPFAVRSRERIRVLTLDPRPARDPAKSESFYLMTAMAPGGEAESVAPKLQEGEGLGRVDLREFDAVVIAGITNLSAADRRVLIEYVKTGGGLLIFPGPYTDTARLNTELEADGLLPARFASRRTLSDEEAVSLNPGSVAHPALSLFKDTSVLNIGTARFTTYYPLEPVRVSDPNAIQIMLRFSNGDPAFIERRFGLGKVIQAASSAGANWNQLPLRAAYVPLLYQLVTYLGTGPTARHNLKLDEPIFLTLPLPDANKPVRVATPDGRKVSANSQLSAEGVTFRFGVTRQAGLYSVEVVGGKTKDAFAVGLPRGESDLAYADPREAGRNAGLLEKNLTIAQNAEQLLAAVRASRYGAEFWRPFLWAVIALMCVESLLAWRFGRRG